MELFKILSICVITAVLAVVLKEQKGEYALVTVLAGGVTVLLLLARNLVGAIGVLQNTIAEYNMDTNAFGVAIKALGIGYVTDFIANTCRDSGQTSLAAKAELAGKCAILILSLPLMISVLNLAVGLIR